MYKSGNVSVFRNYHDCDLQRGSESCLPGLPTNSAKCSKWWRQIKKLMILDTRNYKTKQVFRSYSAIKAERTRHAQIKPIFVIHPFSIFALYREHLLCLLWMTVFIVDPLVLAFNNDHKQNFLLIAFRNSINLVLFFNIFLEFFIGFYKPITKEIELCSKTICLRYLKTFFLIDLLACVPYEAILYAFRSPNGLKVIEWEYFNLLVLFRLLRWSSMIRFLDQLLLQIGLTEAMVIWTRLLLLKVYLVHWWACVFHILPIAYAGNQQYLADNSWLVLGKLYNTVRTRNKEHFLYFTSLLTATSHFFGASEGSQYFQIPFERFMASICVMTGFIFSMYFVANFLQIFGSISIAGSKYDELIYQLEEYSRAKKLPDELQHRVKTYLEYKFQKKFFKEEHILNTLSEHLRYEILLFNCRHIVEKVMALQGLSRGVVGGLIANFKLEVYLQNDVIIKTGDPPFKIFFISHGTVAVYMPNGVEITHHEDGDFFGSLQENSMVTVVAAEITETFSMDAADAEYIFELENEVADRINLLQSAKQTEYRALARAFDDVTHKSVLNDLRKGYILEKRRLR